MFHDAEVSPLFAKGPDQRPVITSLYHLNHRSRLQLLASAIITPNLFVVPNEILDEISIASSSMLSKMGLDQLLAVLPNVVSFDKSLPVLEAKQSPPVGSSVLENWADQIKTKSSSPLISGATFGVASILVPSATFKIKLAYVKAVFQSVHGFLGAKSVSKDNVKLFCVKFASQTSLNAAFLVKPTSSIRLATLKIAKSLVVSESGSLFTAIVLHDMPLGVSAADIKTVLSVFGMVTHVVLKPTGIWQYVMIHFEKLDSAIVRILLLVNQNETILSRDRFKTKLIGGWSCFISWSPDSGYCLRFTLVMFGFQADLDLAVAKTSTLRKCYIWWEIPNCQCYFQCQETDHLAVDCKVALSSFFMASKVFKPYFVGSLSYAKVSAPPVMSEFSLLVASTLPVAVVNLAVGFRLDSLEKQVSDLAALIKSIVESIGSLVVLVFYLLNDNAVKTV
ncbi:hypothetical protein G9A89_009441 [Geosiphon pyriformis]|nr:hypothetical protein G9A89_009441 [Geosiphon pyriformis]